MSTSVGTVAAHRLAARPDTGLDLVLLHGIYGRGRNWQAVGRALVSSRPDAACWLVDLPHHGASGPGAHGDTVAGVAADVAAWASSAAVRPRVVLGHSYGGKVALALAGHYQMQPLQVWVVDSTPEVKAPSGSAWGMLHAVRALPDSFASREEAQAGLEARGYDRPVAQWMTTNLVRDGDRFRWHLDFDAMERLLRDFFATDLWSAIEHPAGRHDIHVLKATRSSVISPAALERLRAAEGPRMHVHERDGGHWIHAERPDVVAALILEYLPM